VLLLGSRLQQTAMACMVVAADTQEAGVEAMAALVLVDTVVLALVLESTAALVLVLVLVVMAAVECMEEVVCECFCTFVCEKEAYALDMLKMEHEIVSVFVHVSLSTHCMRLFFWCDASIGVGVFFVCLLCALCLCGRGCMKSYACDADDLHRRLAAARSIAMPHSSAYNLTH